MYIYIKLYSKVLYIKISNQEDHAQVPAFAPEGEQHCSRNEAVRCSFTVSKVAFCGTSSH